MAEPSSSNEGDMMVVCCVDAVRETCQALSAVGGHLEQEAARVNIDPGVAPTAAIRKYPLLYAFFRANRQLSKLKECLLLQADVPLQEYWREQRDLVVVAEGRKTQTSLLRAQQVAKETYEEGLSKLDETINTGTPYDTKVFDLIESCDRATEASETALSSVIAALSDFPARTLCPSAALDDHKPPPLLGVGAGGGEPQVQYRRQVFPPSPIALSSAPAPPRFETPPGAVGTEVRAAPTTTTVTRHFNRGVQRSASVNARSCRSRAAAAASAGFVPTEARRPLRRASPAAAAAGAAAQRGASFSSGKMTATAQAVLLGLAPVTRAGNIRRQAAAVQERRKVGSRSPMSVLGGGVGGVQAATAVAARSARFVGGRNNPGCCYDDDLGERQVVEEDDNGEDVVVVRNRKLSPAERDAASASVESPMCGGVVAGGARCRCRLTEADVGGRDFAGPRLGQGVATRLRGNMALAAVEAAVRNRRATAMPTMSSMSSPSVRPSGDGHGADYAGADSAAGAPREAAGGEAATAAAAADAPAVAVRSTKRGASRLTSLYETASRPTNVPTEYSHDDDDDDEVVAQAILDEAAISALLVSSHGRARLGEEDSPHARRRSLIRRHSMGAELDAGSPRRRSTKFGGLGARAAAREGDSEVRDVDANEAAALRLAKQEQEAQAREDELLALRLAAREEAAHERSLSRHRHGHGPHYPHRRSRRRSPPSSLTAGSAAAFAAGGEVSEAVRALQFQDINENDFETLLALDEAGGEGGRCCGGGKGLTEEAMEEALEAGEAAGVALEESCAICLLDFEMGDEISTLPCGHVFHTQCIRKWLLVRNLCPTDMQPVVAELAEKY